MPTTEREVALRAVLATVAPGDVVARRTGAHPAGQYRRADRPRLDQRRSSSCAPAGSRWTSSSRPPGCGSCARWTARWCCPPTATSDHAGGHAPDARPGDAHRGVRYPAPHGAAGGAADGLPGDLGVASRCGSSAFTWATSGTCWRPSADLLSRANQAIATLERYKTRLDEVSNTLSALEIEDLVTVRDAAMRRRSGWRWCAASPTRSSAMSSSSAPTGGCWRCSSRS